MYKHIPSNGYLTEAIRVDYINMYIKNKNFSAKAFTDMDIVSLYAHISKPIYFWQLYNILGEYHIKNIITIFYTNIFNDKNPINFWFTKFFKEKGNLEYHINNQTNLWLDIMGGGKLYTYILKYNKTLITNNNNYFNLNNFLVYNINKKYNDKWILYMIETFKNINTNIFDNRIITCLIDFITFFIYKYNMPCDFNFIENKQIISKI